ncbi:PREDICTED: early nodulin-like protein 1 [Nelumbo nucifera]|uniref:Phytocyanin domain-containing protein n=2 Tax=Nelumbo nucifera TaxID=4432 RepID=A0A822ZGN3_NELNU|nr:PREDICTED: early nodulin-like protein 1 [Nelumbo nucifera]DAD45284.1 TPA_asm: hypothetical protein HUJ06_003514 [Nelumbo nucifera]
MSMESSSTVLSSSLAVLFLLFSFTQAREFMVGGNANSWKIPSSGNGSLNQWAEANRFRIGDSLVWNYDSQKDSVLQVTKDAYEHCNTSDPIAAFKDGSTKVALHRSGPFYFISGAEGHCQKGQKLIVVVLSPRNGAIVFAPAPAPVALEGPAVAPTSGGHSLRNGFVGAFAVLGCLFAIVLL